MDRKLSIPIPDDPEKHAAYRANVLGKIFYEDIHGVHSCSAYVDLTKKQARGLDFRFHHYPLELYFFHQN